MLNRSNSVPGREEKYFLGPLSIEHTHTAKGVDYTIGPIDSLTILR
jgi:hypothetical protein